MNLQAREALIEAINAAQVKALLDWMNDVKVWHKKTQSIVEKLSSSVQEMKITWDGITESFGGLDALRAKRLESRQRRFVINPDPIIASN